MADSFEPNIRIPLSKESDTAYDSSERLFSSPKPFLFSPDSSSHLLTSFSSTEYSKVFSFFDEDSLTLLPQCSDTSSPKNSLEDSFPVNKPEEDSLQKIFLSDRIQLVSSASASVSASASDDEDDSVESTDSVSYSEEEEEDEEENPQPSLLRQDTDSFITYDPKETAAFRRVAVSKDRYEYLLGIEMNIESILQKGLDNYIKQAEGGCMNNA
jgi:hypothetical protein